MAVAIHTNPPILVPDDARVTVETFAQKTHRTPENAVRCLIEIGFEAYCNQVEIFNQQGSPTKRARLFP